MFSSLKRDQSLAIFFKYVRLWIRLFCDRGFMEKGDADVHIQFNGCSKASFY